MAEVFISYKSERRPAARHLAKVLSAYGFDAWYDYELLPGEDFELRLMGEMTSAKAVVVLWCAMGVESEWVNKEAREAVRTGKFLPCRLEECPLPEEFRKSHTLPLMEWDGSPRTYVLDPLLADIARRVGRDPVLRFRQLRDVDEDWRTYGAPSLAQFALGKPLRPEASRPSVSTENVIAILGPVPSSVSPNLSAHWENAQRGDPAALCNVGYAFDTGTSGLGKNESEAARLYSLAADKGLAVAQYNLGTCYAQGRGVDKDEKNAARLYALAAEQGNAYAQFSLGNMYDDGKGGLKKSKAEFVRWMKLSADQGHAPAQAQLGFAHERGYGGLTKNEPEAARLYALAAEQGNALAQGFLAHMYERGEAGLPIDTDKAVQLYQAAARQGQQYSQDELKRLRKTW